MPYINIATEDPLSEAIAERLVTTCTGFEISERLGLRGKGHLYSNLKSYAEFANYCPLLLLADLDQVECAPTLIADWRSSININPPQGFLFRIAVREVEAWLLADTVGCGSLLKSNKVPRDPDHLADPKATLLRLAERAPRQIRDDLVVRSGQVASQGTGYNLRLRKFVIEEWNLVDAAANSPSLERACRRLRELRD